MRTLEPSHDWIEVEPEENQVTQSGIELVKVTPRRKDDKDQQIDCYRVLAVGPGGYADNGAPIPMSVVAGDWIIVQGVVHEMLLDGAKHYLIRNLQVVSKLRGHRPLLERPMPEMAKVLQ